jgi:hypothetical protein
MDKFEKIPVVFVKSGPTCMAQEPEKLKEETWQVVEDVEEQQLLCTKR